MRKTIVLPALLFAIAGIGCNPNDALKHQQLIL